MYRSEYSDVTYLSDLNVVFVKWKRFCRLNDYRQPLLCAIDIMKAHDGCHYVADTRDGFENDPADKQWLFDVFIPQTASTTCKAIFFIINRDNALKNELEGQSSELSRCFNVHYCFELEDVKAILDTTYRP